MSQRRKGQVIEHPKRRISPTIESQGTCERSAWAVMALQARMLDECFGYEEDG